jgi:hypothetical protein
LRRRRARRAATRRSAQHCRAATTTAVWVGLADEREVTASWLAQAQPDLAAAGPTTNAPVDLVAQARVVGDQRAELVTRIADVCDSLDRLMLAHESLVHLSVRLSEWI